MASDLAFLIDADVNSRSAGMTLLLSSAKDRSEQLGRRTRPNARDLFAATVADGHLTLDDLAPVSQEGFLLRGKPVSQYHRSLIETARTGCHIDARLSLSLSRIPLSPVHQHQTRSTRSCRRRILHRPSCLQAWSLYRVQQLRPPVGRPSTPRRPYLTRHLTCRRCHRPTRTR